MPSRRRIRNSQKSWYRSHTSQRFTVPPFGANDAELGVTANCEDSSNFVLAALDEGHETTVAATFHQMGEGLVKKIVALDATATDVSMASCLSESRKFPIMPGNHSGNSSSSRSANFHEDCSPFDSGRGTKSCCNAFRRDWYRILCLLTPIRNHGYNVQCTKLPLRAVASEHPARTMTKNRHSARILRRLHHLRKDISQFGSVFICCKTVSEILKLQISLH